MADREMELACDRLEESRSTVAALRAELADARAALDKIAALSDKPSDFDGWYDSFGDYADVDPSNMGDVHGHGNDMGRWEAAKIARAARAAAPTPGETTNG